MSEKLYEIKDGIVIIKNERHRGDNALFDLIGGPWDGLKTRCWSGYIQAPDLGMYQSNAPGNFMTKFTYWKN